jgi:heme-degrading monooxygenase HmoA
MSVTVTIRMPVSDVAKAIELLMDKGEFLEGIRDVALKDGLIHHKFVSGDGELMVIDEWDTAEQFQTFFDGTPEVGALMGDIGMSGPPEVSIFNAIDAPGSI